jgi:hypothetical protein
MAAATTAFVLLSIAVIVLLALATYSPLPDSNRYADLATMLAKPLLPAVILMQFLAVGLAQTRPTR